jgi:hypothetical protein
LGQLAITCDSGLSIFCSGEAGSWGPSRRRQLDARRAVAQPRQNQQEARTTRRTSRHQDKCDC